MRTPDRFVLARAGIVNLYEYDDQVFELADGRLLLRGHNTSGKTKALELLLPFCLDGDISPRKLDPFAKNAKEMKWNLVGCVEAEQRIGYVWLEFARLDADGGLEHVTAGIGMKANRGRDGVQRWYFLLRGRRIGHELTLRRGDYPLTRRELVELLGDGDELFDAPHEYRRRLNGVVYGFPSLAQYETMISLLLELRRPHLSKALDARQVAALLSGSLPEIDHDLMRRLGDGLEQLDDLQAALRTLESVRERVEEFNRSAYRGYARAVTAERGERLRRADTSYGNASAARRKADEELEQAREAAAAATRELAAARARRATLDGERDALLQSTEWESVSEIEQLGLTAAHARLAARQADEHADDASGRLVADEADAVTASAAADDAYAAFARALARLDEEADAAGLAARHEAVVPAFDDPERAPTTIGELLRDEAERCLIVLNEHDQLHVALAAAEAIHEQAGASSDEAQAGLRAAAERRAQLQAELQAVSEALVEAIEGWAGELYELHLEPEVLARTIELAVDVGIDGGASPATAWEAVRAARHDALVVQHSQLEAGREELARERAELAAARARLTDERDEPPPAGHTRPASRAGRPGAPLWELVDFAPSVSAQDRAGIEAALEGAGLLDAWVLPDGVLLDADTLDVVLDPATRPRGATLADALLAVEDPRVEHAVVERVLTSIALDNDETPDACAMFRTGRFRLGPAHGHFAKPAAEYVGAAARAERRLRRIAELDIRLTEIDGRDMELATAVARVDGRVATLDAESARFPDSEPLANVRRALTAAEGREREERATLAERERSAVAADEQRQHARQVVAGHARSCGLPDDLDLAAVRTRQTAAHRYEAAVSGTADVAAHRHGTAARLAELVRRLDDARTALAELVRAAELADGEARRLEAEYAEREAALGRTGEEIRARKLALDASLKELRRQISELEQADKDTAVAVKGCEGETERAAEALAGAARERDAALAAFRRLGSSDLFALGLESDTPPDAEHAADWTLSRALEVLRSLPSGRLAVRSGVGELANKVQQRCSELDRALGQQADMGVVAESDADGVLIVRVRQGARTLTVPQLVHRLDTEVEERERTLSAEQRRIFNDTLLEEIAEHLRERIERVDELVADMNATLTRCPTGSGKTVRLDWAAAEDDSGELRTVTRLLRRSVATLGEAERAPLIAFFRDRIQRAREQTASIGTLGEPGAAAHLRDAFDYRGWFTFTLYEVKDGQRAKLTAKRHALGSGGEQAVLIHMPLFAAAAALYSSSRDGRAPRLVMLDEALSGIDDETREKVLAVLVALDLDVVMTSHELWGTYRTVPSLSIYQLHRENGAFGVASEHFLWDGESLRELEQATTFE
jgi:uncharacterized protein (TIGR02680 family)